MFFLSGMPVFQRTRSHSNLVNILRFVYVNHNPFSAKVDYIAVHTNVCCKVVTYTHNETTEMQTLSIMVYDSRG